MPLSIRMTDLSTPQAWILPDASPNNDGIMTAAMAAKLASLSPGGSETLDQAYTAGNEILPTVGRPVVFTADVGAAFRIRSSDDSVLFEVAPDGSVGAFGRSVFAMSGTGYAFSEDNEAVSLVHNGPADDFNNNLPAPNILRAGAIWNGSESVTIGERIASSVVGVGTPDFNVRLQPMILVGGSSFAPITYGKINGVDNGYVEVDGALRTTDVAVANVGQDVNLDLGLGTTFVVTIDQAAVLNNPINAVVDQSQIVYITLIGGENGLDYGDVYRFPGGVTPTLATAPNVLIFLSQGGFMYLIGTGLNQQPAG
jgi:hypothetical protein